ncbi:Uncharacterized protein FWK35_00033937, partial [Aphis craccivora]
WSQLFVAVLLMFKYFIHWSDTDGSTAGGSSDNQTSTYTEINYYSGVDFDGSIFSKLSGTILIIYASYYLKIATYTPPSNGDQSLPQNHTTVEIGTEVNSANDQRPTLEVKNITNNTN